MLHMCRSPSVGGGGEVRLGLALCCMQGSFLLQGDDPGCLKVGDDLEMA